MTTTTTVATIAALEALIRRDADFRAQVRDLPAVSAALAADILRRDPAAQREFAGSADPVDKCAAYLRRLAVEAPAPTLFAELDQRRPTAVAEQEAAAAAAPSASAPSRGALAIAPSALAALQAAQQAAGGSRRARASMRVQDGVAIVPIQGVIGGGDLAGAETTVADIRADLQTALGREDVKAILLAIDSPGGSVSGIDDLAAEIRSAKARKPIIAHSENVMASAAYWLASGATKLFASRSASVGSIGVVAGVLDDSRRMKNAGIDPVLVKSTPAKGSVQSNGSIGDREREDIAREVQQLHGLFVASVAEGRGIPLERAQQLGDGRLHVAAAAPAGLLDGVATFAEALAIAGTARAAASSKRQVAHV